ncbi:PIR protein [Plasmodium yoelii]|uniref:PIR protein n=2 Tax=Plasmodium yoelii TaxID=5861 RepID=A0AAE9WWX9_PLAYO|nr:PIR protein [Plasmodium yoelii]WBY60486.1 PIR protein [Plasmodium yoelii yoelii]VTZ81094.1 PIR protein [Plasmodium yoelii]|eukprot:XP_022813786.1 PIR protein [Plasmodium yoelii]
MNDNLCRDFVVLNKYFPDGLNKTILDFDENSGFKKYCPNKDSGGNECNNDLDKITAGFLWLLEQWYSAIIRKSYNEDNADGFFLYMISWFSYKLNQITEYKTTPLNDFYNTRIKNNHKYNSFTSPAYTFSDLKKFMDEKNDFMNISIEDLSKFYDPFKLLCSMYDNVETNKDGDTLLNNANDFVNKCTELSNNHNIEGIVRSKMLAILSTNYDNFKKYCTRKGDNCKDISSLPEIATRISALTSRDISSSSSIGNKLFTVLSIFGAIAFFLGISYKYSLFGFRKRAQKQYLKEKIKKIKKRMNH